MATRPTLVCRVLAAILVSAGSTAALNAAKLLEVAVLDRDHLAVGFSEGEVKFKDDATGASAYSSLDAAPADNWVVAYGALDLAAATNVKNWTITSPDDPAYRGAGASPAKVFRKSKINGMAQLEWDNAKRDFRYETPMAHTLFLRLPAPLQDGKRYALVPAAALDPAQTPREFVFDILHSRSEAIHLNLVGFIETPTIKAADLYCWLGDGGARDYAAFVGAKVWLYDVGAQAKQPAGSVRFWRRRAPDLGGYDLTGSDVWTADFTGAYRPGTYRLVVEGVGCSQDFSIGRTVYAVPYQVSLRGFYYMRIGEPVRANIRPVPRQPPFIPGKSPPATKVLITTMQPFHPEWETFAPGDKWDKPGAWERFVKDGRPVNSAAWGGHADALDWDRHLGHVALVYDLLLPYLLTNGALADDDTGSAESGNGIPDLLDEARYEVDFWLRLRDGDGYSHGVTNPDQHHVFYQAGTTVVAAWANAANAAMLADCFRIAGRQDLAREYLAHAVKAYAYAERQPDQQLARVLGVGDTSMRGADFKMTAAAYLFNLTGDPHYEKTVAELSLATDDQADVTRKDANQLWAIAGYLLTPRTPGFPDLVRRLKRGIVAQAAKLEADYSGERPSRRAADQATGYFHTAQNVHRTLLAHRLSGEPRFLDALVLEADWGLGRNPLNMIQMTTATTPLAASRSVANAYTSGRNDGTPGLHPGHTPYLNMDNWGDAMIMAQPRWLADKGYPAFAQWPRGECYFNTRWVWAHSEFTPQQTMCGKMALYGYLYGISKETPGR